MTMQRWITGCALLLLVQVGLILVTHANRQGGAIHPTKEVVVAVNAAEINQMVLEDNQGRRLLFKKEGQRWLLPDSGSFPADKAKVQGLIDRLVGLQRGWPEATTVEAAGRFKVAPDRFVRKLTLGKDSSGLATVYFGTSPGLRKIYLRVDGDTDIHTLALSEHDLEVKADTWIDTTILRFKPEQAVRIDLPGLRLERSGEGLQPAGLGEGEEVVAERRDALVNQVAGLTVTGLLGTVEKPEYGLDHPVLRFTVELEGGQTIDYLFGQPAQPDQGQGEVAEPAGATWYVLKVSDREQVFRVEGWQVDEIKAATRAALVRIKGKEAADKEATAVPAETPAGQPEG